VPADLTFYGRLREVFWPPDRWETGGRFLGAIWSLAVRKLSNEEAEQLLLAAGVVDTSVLLWEICRRSFSSRYGSNGLSPGAA
jgi:hypothetical protein